MDGGTRPFFAGIVGGVMSLIAAIVLNETSARQYFAERRGQSRRRFQNRDTMAPSDDCSRSRKLLNLAGGRERELAQATDPLGGPQTAPHAPL
jgi:hypothetical protein